MRSNAELFEIIKALYVSGLGGNVDRLANLAWRCDEENAG